MLDRCRLQLAAMCIQYSSFPTKPQLANFIIFFIVLKSGNFPPHLHAVTDCASASLVISKDSPDSCRALPVFRRALLSISKWLKTHLHYFACVQMQFQHDILKQHFLALHGFCCMIAQEVGSAGSTATQTLCHVIVNRCMSWLHVGVRRLPTY